MSKKLDLGKMPKDTKIPVGYKWCSGCQHVKVIELFNNDKSTKDGKTRQCKACQKARARANYKKTKSSKYHQKYYKARREKLLDRHKDYYANNKEDILSKQAKYRNTKKGKAVMKKAHDKRKELIANNKGTPYTRWEIIERDSDDNGTTICQICHKPIENLSDIHIDHIIPIAQGGLDCKENVRAVHVTCNLSRPRDGRDLNATND